MPAWGVRCPIPSRLPDPVDSCAIVDEVHNFLAYFFRLISAGHDRELAEKDADKFHVDEKGLYECTYREWRSTDYIQGQPVYIHLHSRQCRLEELPAQAIVSWAACFGSRVKNANFVRRDRIQETCPSSALVGVDSSLESEDPWIVLEGV